MSVPTVGHAKCFKIGRIIIPFWLVALVLGALVGSSVVGYYLTVVNVPLQVKDPVEIISYPSGWSLYPGQLSKFNVTVLNHAPITYSAVLEFQTNNLTFQMSYLTFSNLNYTVVPGQQNLEAWLRVAPNAPAVNVTVTITFARSPSAIPTANSLVNGGFENGFIGWNVTGVVSISDTIVHSGKFSAYISDAVYDSYINQTVMLPASNNWQFTGWIYPTIVGMLPAYSCGDFIFFVFVNRITMTKAFNVGYLWSGYEGIENGTSNGVDTLWFRPSFSAYTWNYLSRSLHSDILSYFKGVDLTQFVLRNITVHYHFSNGSPGSFYVDDLDLSIILNS